MINGSFDWKEDFVKVFENWSIWIAICGAVVLGGIKIWKKIKNTIIQTDNFIQIHSEIHELLTELRVLTDSARTQIIQFHNGEYFIDGISMRKFSLTHESVEKGVESDGSRIQGYLCSMFLPLLQLLVEDDGKIRYLSDLKDSYVKQYFESRNVEAFSLLPIKINNNITGFVLIQWCNSKIVDSLDETYISGEIRKISNSITIQLSLQKK
jgi:hypothetical protein